MIGPVVRRAPAAGDDDGGRGAVWDVDPASWAERACALANRTLTRDEWETFLPGRPYEPACAR